MMMVVGAPVLILKQRCGYIGPLMNGGNYQIPLTANMRRMSYRTPGGVGSMIAALEFGAEINK